MHKNRAGIRADEIAVALEKNSNVTTLNLRGTLKNKVRIAVAMETNSTVTTFNLRGNGIDSHGAEQIAVALEKNSAVTILDLCPWRRADRGGLGEERDVYRERPQPL